MKLFQYSVIPLYSGRERRLSSVNELSLKICNPLNFKSPTATDGDTGGSATDLLAFALQLRKTPENLS